MKVVILAAGMGTRLGGHQPKPLTELDSGNTIIDLQLEGIARAAPEAAIWGVVGYRREDIMSAVPGIGFVDNLRYSRENTSKSLLRALREIGDADDVLWMNGDVVFGEGLLDEVIDAGTSCMAVNRGPVGEEEVKYRTAQGGRIVEVSKSVACAEGEALGVNFFRADDVQSLMRNLDACEDNDYFERAIQLCIDDGVEVRAVDVSRFDCVEVDFPEDLRRANEIVLAWGRA